MNNNVGNNTNNLDSATTSTPASLQQGLRVVSGIESQQTDDATNLVSQHPEHIVLYHEYCKQLKAIGSRVGLESTLSAEEVDLLFEDLQGKRGKEPNLNVQQFIRNYIDDVRTLYQLCRGKNFPEVEQDRCADGYKRERAKREISLLEFVESYSVYKFTKNSVNGGIR